MIHVHAAATSLDPAPEPQDDMQTAQDARSSNLVRRMMSEGLEARVDPIDTNWCILTRRRGDMTLGAGRVRRADIDDAVLQGCLSGDVRLGWRVSALPDATARIPCPPLHAMDTDQPPAKARAGRRDAAPSAMPAVNERESPLVWLARRRDAQGEPFLPPAAVLAGERLRQDATSAVMLPSVTVNWSRFEQAAGHAAPRDLALASERVVAARQRVRAAHRSLGPSLGNFVIDVCVFLVPLQTAEQQRGWPARSAKLVLKLALEQLASHYGIATVANGPARAAIGGWLAEDGRASMSGWFNEPAAPQPVAGHLT